MKSVLTQSALDVLCEKYYIPDVVHPQLPGPNDRIHNSPTSQIGISRYYTLEEGCYPNYWDDEDEDMDLFAFIQHADPTKVRIGEREVREGEVPLLELTRGRIIPLAGGNDDGAAADHAKQSGLVVHIGRIDIEVDAETQDLVADKPKKVRKRKTADGTSGSGLPPKRLREDHGTFGDADASTAGKSLVALQDLLDKSTLAAEIGVTAAATLPFVTSSVTPTPEHEGGEYTDSVSATNLRTKRPVEKFVISLDTPHDSNANAVDDEVSSVVRSTISDPAVLTTAIVTTVVAGTSVLQPKEVNEPTRASIFADSTSACNIGPDVAGLSQPAGNDISSESFYVSLEMDSETLHQTYVLKWDVMNDSVLDDSNACCSAEVRMRLECVLRGKKRLKGKCGMQANLLKEKDTQIAGLKAHLSLKEAKAVEVIRLRSRIADIEAANANRTDSTLESEKDKLVDQVEAMQDEQVKALSDRVAGIDADLINLALHMDEEFYPRAFGCAIDKGMQDSLKADIDHGRAGRGLDVIAAYDPSTKANFVSTVDALRAVNFPLLAQLESRRDASMADILLRLEGLAAEILEASQLQPSFEQLIVPIHRLEDQMVIGETSLSFALNVAHYRVQRLKRDAASCRLSLTDAMVPLLKPLSVRSLTGEASTSMVPSAAVNTALSITFIQASTIPPLPSTEVPSSPKIVFEEEELNTTLKHTLAP
ncbi:hypothetical protein Tco_0564772 [Tanacetum coccineum]